MIHRLEGLIVFFNFHLPWIMFFMFDDLKFVLSHFAFSQCFSVFWCLMTYVSWSLKVLHLLIFHNCLIKAIFYSSYQHTFPTCNVERIVFSHSAGSNSRMFARASAPVWWGPEPGDKDSGRPGDCAQCLPLAGGAIYLSIYLSIYLLIILNIYLSVCLSICLSVTHTD